jgi:hypothetical protein
MQLHMEHRQLKRTARVTLWCLVLGCIAVAGCGQDSTPSDAEQITAVLQRTATSEDTKLCVRDFSQRFVREVYGSLQQCRVVTGPDPEDLVVSRASIAATRINAGRATARLSLAIRDGDTVSGRVALVKVAGNWKLDRFGVDFLRSYIASLPANVPSGESHRIARCFARASHTVSTRTLRQVANALLGERLGLPDVFIRCLL